MGSIAAIASARHQPAWGRHPRDVVKRGQASRGGESPIRTLASLRREITLDDQETYGLSQIHGAYVLLVSPGSPAADAGLVAANAETGRGGDLVIAIDDRPIRDFSDLNTYLVLEAEVGQTVQLTVVRGGETVTVPLTLGARP